MTPEELELITVEIVAYAGDARSKYVEALNYANEVFKINRKRIQCNSIYGRKCFYNFGFNSSRK